jgi:hypothetical protein
MLVVPLHRFFKPAVETPALRTGRAPGLGGWSTSSFGEAADTSPLELFELSEHLDRCHRSRGRLFSALCLSDSVSRFLAPRFMTTLVAAAVLASLLAML